MGLENGLRSPEAYFPSTVGSQFSWEALWPGWFETISLPLSRRCERAGSNTLNRPSTPGSHHIHSNSAHLQHSGLLSLSPSISLSLRASNLSLARALERRHLGCDPLGRT